jgi:hypothetical protein
VKNLNVARVLLFCCLLPAVSLLQGCVPVATGVISYESAISAQAHAAYTEYLFATQAKINRCSKLAIRFFRLSLRQNGEKTFTIRDSNTLIITHGRSPPMRRFILLTIGRPLICRWSKQN